jgi:hypothetical protein
LLKKDSSNNNKFELIVCIEARHCFTNFEKILKEASTLLSDNKEACFVLADGSVSPGQIGAQDTLLKKYFDIELRHIVTPNVKNA